MKKRSVFLFSLLAMLLLVVTGCGTPKAEVGMNELTLEQLEKKLDNHETFLLLTFAADEQDVKDVKLIEAFDDSLKRAGLTGFYVNLQGEDEKTIKELEQKYKHPKSDEWNPLESGMILVENGGAIRDYNVYISEDYIKSTRKQNAIFEEKEIDRELRGILEYINYYKIELTEY